ncbi:glycosyl transferase [Salinicola endophyticus]|uniref:Glycosyl transferase n=1 Tax=Salinicola endophyticus TaxID=1949083 RepID=A0ABY8FFU3_9GAMM|nr:glycosyl transferase [Salinicola endophyticus]WFF40433.1 glycosyl transferase [Salinicola endophyticus]
MTPTSSNPNHWSRIRESGSAAGVRTMVWIRRHLGRLPFQFMLTLVIGYFYVAHGLHRRASHTYLVRLWRHLHGAPPRRLTWLSLRHFRSFGQSLMDKIDAWSGIPPQVEFAEGARQRFLDAVSSGRGGLMFVSHVGNMEICTAMSDMREDFRATLLMHTRNAQEFDAVLARSTHRDNPPEIIEVSEITPSTAMQLGQRIADGGFVVIAADRVPISDSGRARTLSFLGHPARFPEGPFWLASLLRCPVYTIGCFRHHEGYRVEFDTFDDTQSLGRRQREAWIGDAMQRYVAWLTRQCENTPLQWFNFFPFWLDCADAHPDAGDDTSTDTQADTQRD